MTQKGNVKQFFHVYLTPYKIPQMIRTKVTDWFFYSNMGGAQSLNKYQVKQLYLYPDVFESNSIVVQRISSQYELGASCSSVNQLVKIIKHCHVIFCDNFLAFQSISVR